MAERGQISHSRSCQPGYLLSLNVGFGIWCGVAAFCTPPFRVWNRAIQDANLETKTIEDSVVLSQGVLDGRLRLHQLVASYDVRCPFLFEWSKPRGKRNNGYI